MIDNVANFIISLNANLLLVLILCILIVFSIAVGTNFIMMNNKLAKIEGCAESSHTDKKHYYSFAFIEIVDNKETTASVYVGYPSKYVSVAQIQAAKEAAGVGENATMLSCSYLGKMSKGTMGSREH